MKTMKPLLDSLWLALSQRRGWGDAPEPKLHPRSLAYLQKRYGTPVPYAVAAAANRIGMEEFRKLENASKIAEVKRRREAAAELARRQRQDEWALELERGRAERGGVPR